MATAIDDTLNDFIEKLRRESARDIAAESGYRQGNAGVQAPPVSAPQPRQRRLAWYGRVATALILLLLVTTAVSYFLYRAEREAITSRIDAMMKTPLESPLERRLLDLEKKVGTSARTNERRMQTVEQQLVDNQQVYTQRLHDLEQRLVQMQAPQERRLQRVEQRMEKLQPPGGKRLQAIENRLVQITARMDAWAAVMADLSSAGQPDVTLDSATVAEPPPAYPVEPVMVARNNSVLLPPQPLTAAAPEQSREPAAAAARTGQGDWVINIGSYLYEKTAARKRGEFQDKGVTAELVTATVRGKTIYRVQVPGFDSMAEASRHASHVRETLGLGETWIRRR